jgi:hypothetical protein
MSGSDAPRLALARLGRLARPLETVGETAALAALERDPLAALAAPPLDNGVLESLLERLTGAPRAGSGPRTARRTSPQRRRTEREPRPRTRARALVRHGLETLSPERAPRPSRQVSGRPRAPEPVEALAPIARGVPAASSPVDVAAASFPSGSEAASELESGPVALDAVLRRLAPVLEPFPEPTPRPPVVGAEPGAAPGVGSSSGPAASRGVPPEARTGEPVGRGLRKLAGAPAARADPLSPRPHSLAELVRRWQDDRAEREETAAPALRPAPAGTADPADSQGLAVALERLLLGELRRHGIEVEVG